MNLVDFAKGFTPSTLSPTGIDEAITYSLEYLRSANIPAPELSCCANTLGQYHSEMALIIFLYAVTIVSGKLESNSRLTARIVEAWPEIHKWLLYTFSDWIVRGKFIGRQKVDRIEGFRSIIPFLDAVCRVPDLREMVLRTAYDRQAIFTVLSFCWQMESEDWFVNPWKDDYTSAAGPLVMLTQADFDGGKPIPDDPTHDFFTMAAIATNLDPEGIARMTLGRLKDTASLPLGNMAPHIGILSTLGRQPSYSSALFAQHSLQDVIRILVDLTSAPYNPETAQEVEACIRPCLIYVLQSLLLGSNGSLAAEALRTECKTWQNAGKDGLDVSMRPQDIEFACDLAMFEIAAHCTEIAQVWKKEIPQRAPVVSVDFSVDSRGVIRVGEECFMNPPPTLWVPPGIDTESYFRATWEMETSKEIHDEHAVVCVFLPYGNRVQTHWSSIPINVKYAEGTVVERLIQTVEFLCSDLEEEVAGAEAAQVEEDK
ncbi:hypothetical protein B0H19DRAFT_1273248 [Mycena capillaripes]|nr:hypothetical protein B0H19DRAFT_1273248 [Mycena capillaripes]